jgi:hypothetical protein
VPPGIKPQEVMAALAEFVDFSSLGYRPSPPVLSRDDSDKPYERGAAFAAPRKGMTREEAEHEFGAPVSENEHREGGLRVTTLRFVRSDQQIVGDFVEGILVRFSMSSR